MEIGILGWGRGEEDSLYKRTGMQWKKYFHAKLLVFLVQFKLFPGPVPPSQQIDLGALLSPYGILPEKIYPPG